MLCFWSDPHHLIEPQSRDRSIGLMEGLVRALLPEQRSRVAPGDCTALIIRDPLGVVGTRGIWGLVPSWAKQGREPYALVDAQKVKSTPATRDLWSSTAAVHRCLVPATGWIDRGRSGEVALRPTEQPVTFAAIRYTLHHPGEPQGRHTFAILTTVAADDMRRDVARVPLIVPAREREAWLGMVAAYAEPCLRLRAGEIECRPIANGDARLGRRG